MEVESEDNVTIEQLPAEMMLHVFSFLNSGDLKRSALVCKKWNGVITQNAATMQHLPLSLEGNWLRLKQNTKDFRNKYHSITIEYSSTWTNNAVDIMHHHGKEARLLNLSCCSFTCDKLNVITKMFRKLSKLEKLKICDTDFDYGDIDRVKAVSMPELKSVVLHYSDLAILKFIENCQLTSLKVNLDHDGVMTDPFIDFLVGQDHLEELAICGASIYSDGIDVDKIKAMKFPLKRLALHKMGNFLGSEANTLMFLDQFTDTLEEFELGNKFEMSVYEMIFKKLKKLKVLSICLSSAPAGRDFYRKLRANTSIKKLIVNDFDGTYVDQLQGIIGNSPRIETLVLESDRVTNDMMVFISNNLRMLKHLKLETIRGSFLRNVRFGSLKSIAVKNLEEDISADDWKTIVKAMPNVEKLSIEFVEDKDSIGDHAFKIITKGLRQLSHIRIGNGFVAARGIFNKLLNNCKQLRTVEISAEAVRLNPKAVRGFTKEGLRLVLLSEDELSEKFKMESYGMWLAEDLEDEIRPYDADLEDDSDDEDSDDSDGLDVFHMMFGLMAELANDSDDQEFNDNEYIYFDSDGEMANWLDDGGADFYDLD